MDFNTFNNHETSITRSNARHAKQVEQRTKPSGWTLGRFIKTVIVVLAITLILTTLYQTNVCVQGVRCTEN